MDQKKIGAFLREQRKKKELTQEMPAEMLGVSNRTVSRWETGAGMPDFSVLIEMAKYYGVTVDEILNGGQTEQREKTSGDTMSKVAEYTGEEKRRLLKMFNLLLWIALAAVTAETLIVFLHLANVSPYEETAQSCRGLSFGILAMGIVITRKYEKFRKLKPGLLKSAKLRMTEKSGN